MNKIIIVFVLILLVGRAYFWDSNKDSYFEVIDNKEVSLNIIEQDSVLLIELKLSVHSGELSDNLSDYLSVTQNDTNIVITGDNSQVSGGSHHKEFQFSIPYQKGTNRFQISIISNSRIIEEIDYIVRWKQ